jgi:hypothetical protein
MTAVKELRALEADAYFDTMDTRTPTESTGTHPLHTRFLSLSLLDPLSLIWFCPLLCCVSRFNVPGKQGPGRWCCEAGWVG